MAVPERAASEAQADDTNYTRHVFILGVIEVTTYTAKMVMSKHSELHRLFCDNVRQRRSELKLTQEQVAESLGMSQPGYAQIEHGKTVPSLAILERVARALRIKPTDLLKPITNGKKSKRA